MLQNRQQNLAHQNIRKNSQNKQLHLACAHLVLSVETNLVKAFSTSSQLFLSDQVPSLQVEVPSTKASFKSIDHLLATVPPTY